MPDVFISYSRLDNRGLEAVDYEIPNAIDRFVDIYKYEFDLSDEEMAERFFRDEWSIVVGDEIPDAINRALSSCSVMLAFFSPAYFRSEECFSEWRAFDAMRRVAGKKSDGKDKKLLIPIEVKPVPPERFLPPHPHDLEVESERWYEELVTKNGRKRIITSELLINRGNARALADRVCELHGVVEEHIANVRGTTPDKLAEPNVMRIETPITSATLKAPEIVREIQEKGPLRYSRHLPVCVIYTGGTIGMVKKEDSDSVHADYEMVASIHDLAKPLASRLASLPVDVHLFRFANAIDSSAVTARNWVDLAKLIEEQAGNYQGFVILHGTNTLAYTASALSFLLSGGISQPVILTGAEVPLSNVNTDAVHNVENAIRAAAHQAYGGPIPIPEVCVYWSNHLYRGNRVTKKMASDRSASFHCPNMPVPLATLANDKLDVEYLHVNVPVEPGKPRIRDLSAVDVAILFIHPNMDFEQIDKGFAQSPDGLILLSYGPGNVPDDLVFIEMVRRLIDEGTIVANITQCPYGRVELKLFETSATLFDLGVIDGYDMTLEAAYTKLLWAIAAYPDRASRGLEGAKESVKAHFQEDCAGEMSASIFTQHWPASKFTGGSDSQYRISDTGDFRNRFNRLDIAEAFIRIEGMRFPAETDRSNVRIYYGPPPLRDTDDVDDDPDTLLAEFTKGLTPAERADGFDKNLEVTHTFRKSFDNNDFVLSVGLDGVPGVTFKSVRLVVYTKGLRHRGV